MLSHAHPNRSELLVGVASRQGRITLNRPRALNALTLEMLGELAVLLGQWAENDAIDSVLISGAGERAFCAGADVKSVYFAGQPRIVAERGSLAADFFRAEYELDYLIACYPKPILVYADAITMGGGMGIAVHASHCIVSESTIMAMPETAIGFIPDVGASYFLSRLGPLGVLLALTGHAIDGRQAVELGLATHFVERAHFDALQTCMANRDVDSCLSDFSAPLTASEDLILMRELAERCFSASSVSEITERLSSVAGQPASGLARVADTFQEKLRERSPTSVSVAWEQLRRGRELSLRECLVMEYRTAQRCFQHRDFYEGVRAALVDKDRAPQWRPARIEDVDSQLVASYFEDLGDQELVLETA